MSTEKSGLHCKAKQTALQGRYVQKPQPYNGQLYVIAKTVDLCFSTEDIFLICNFRESENMGTKPHNFAKMWSFILIWAFCTYYESPTK